MKVKNIKYRGMIETNTQPCWWDSDCDVAKSNKYAKLRKFRLSKTECDFREYVNHRNIYKTLTRAKRLSFERERRNELIKQRKNPSKFWKLIKDAKPGNSNVTIPIVEWFDYFRDLFSSKTFVDVPEETYVEGSGWNADVVYLDIEITNEEIKNSVKNFRNGCAPGIDGNCIEMFKYTLDITLPYLNRLFNKILEKGQFPLEWSENIIVPPKQKRLH